jgi:hypothetical protein
MPYFNDIVLAYNIDENLVVFEDFQMNIASEDVAP